MLSVGPKMDGGPNMKFFESPETLTALDGVKNWLQKNAKKVGKSGNCRNTTNVCFFSTFKMSRSQTKLYLLLQYN